MLDAFVDPASQTPSRLNATYKDPAAGSVQIAATATDLGNGRFRYVYVLMNHNFDPKLRAITLPMGPNILVEQPSFSDGDQDATNNWIHSGGIGQQTWVAPKASARLAWGTAITITYIANGSPITGTAPLTRGDNGRVLYVKTLMPQRTGI